MSRQQPRNLQALLRFAVEATRSEDAPADAAPMQPMTEERRSFLEHAMNSMVMNVVYEMEEATKLLSSGTHSEDEQLAALEFIRDNTCDIDAALDFCKIGGLQVLLSLLSPDRPTRVRASAASALGDVVQNNAVSQKQLLEMDGLQKLLPLLDVVDVDFCAIRGVSSLVLGCEPAAAKFIELGGLEISVRCLQGEPCPTALAVRTMYMLTNLCKEHPGIAGELIKLDIIASLAPLIMVDLAYSVQMTPLFMLLEELCNANNNVTTAEGVKLQQYRLQELHRAELRIADKLNEIIHLERDSDDSIVFEEIVAQAKSILRTMQVDK